MTAQDRKRQVAPQPSTREPAGLGARERAVTAYRPKVRWASLLVGFAVGVPLILRDPDRQFALIVLGVLLLLLAGVVVLVIVRRPAEDCCTLYARGLTLQEGSGPVVSTTWDQIQTVERGIAVHGRNGDVAKRLTGLTIGLAAGVLTLSDRFTDSSRLFARIDQQFSERRIPRAMAALRGGDHVSFASAWEREHGMAGIASISAAGLRFQDDVFDWDEISGAAADRGQLTIGTRHGRNLEVPAYGFPNLAVFVALVNQLAAGNIPGR